VNDESDDELGRAAEETFRTPKRRALEDNGSKSSTASTPSIRFKGKPVRGSLIFDSSTTTVRYAMILQETGH